MQANITVFFFLILTNFNLYIKRARYTSNIFCFVLRNERPLHIFFYNILQLKKNTILFFPWILQSLGLKVMFSSIGSIIPS